MSESTEQHRRDAQSQGSIACAVITVSDTRTPETDGGGALIADLLVSASHRVVSRLIVKDEAKQIAGALREIKLGKTVQAVMITGGTGITRRDVTPDIVESFLDKRLDGFGEIFRVLSFEEIGPAAMLSRAVAGVMGEILVFAMPGSTAAVRLAMERLIIPDLRHLVHEARK
ncbi:MAG: MogA/MoaB family molybdenum cofactor biosynthesis protein [Candidatus Sumerlaeia bacterium]|nr:MogA/MoaB family molybdenum cofactor biosynthesis protein [Candidatus Sumerlaeia bacterium]